MTRVNDTIYVRLVGESVDVWRPVHAEEVSQAVYRIVEQLVPHQERWEFEPGTLVDVQSVQLEDGPAPVAVRRVTR